MIAEYGITPEFVMTALFGLGLFVLALVIAWMCERFGGA